MAERVSPLAAWTGTFAALPASIRIRERPFRTQLSVRGEPAAGAGLGGPLPALPCTAVRYGDVEALWLGPDEWLVVAGPDRQDELEQRLRAGAAAVTDVSAQRTTLALSGPAVRDVLAGGCAIDLHPRVSPPGTCVQTLLARTGVILVVRDDGMELLVRSSFADYLARWLVDAVTHSELTQ